MNCFLLLNASVLIMNGDDRFLWNDNMISTYYHIINMMLLDANTINTISSLKSNPHLLMCAVCMHLYLHCLHKQAYLNGSTTYFCYSINTVPVQTMTLSPTIFCICPPSMFPILCIYVNVRRASWFISWVVSPWGPENFTFHTEVNTRVESKRQACLWMSVTHWQPTLVHLSSFKEAATVGSRRLDLIDNFHKWKKCCMVRLVENIDLAEWSCSG